MSTVSSCLAEILVFGRMAHASSSEYRFSRSTSLRAFSYFLPMSISWWSERPPQRRPPTCPLFLEDLDTRRAGRTVHCPGGRSSLRSSAPPEPPLAAAAHVRLRSLPHFSRTSIPAERAEPSIVLMAASSVVQFRS